MSVVNLNKARKAKARAEAKAKADENAIRHGRTKAEKRQADAEEAQRLARLEDHRREP